MTLSSRTLVWSMAAIAGVVIAVALGNAGGKHPQSAPLSTIPAPTTESARFVGSQSCAACHASQYQAWQTSHHARAMQAADSNSVLAPFNGETLSENGVTSQFSRRNGKFYVRTDGADGQMAEFQITQTFGITPLQQYLIPMPDGCMQALGIAWDARPQAAGGQRWFHLLAGQKIKAGDALHWTGRQQNWNFMCAECHTTQFKKNFDPVARQFNSSWSELGVGCEACHGPGSNHVQWAAHPASGPNYTEARKGLAIALDERSNVTWAIDPASGNASRSRQPAVPRKEMELCARCHAHRSQISDDYVFGGALLDTHLPSLLSPGLYWNDGQMRSEVYNYQSFMQSKMFQKGVSCSDCHEPHNQKLRLPGNQTCEQCHAAAKYEAPAHHHHQANSAGAQCAACHMPTTTYMTVDARHDHSIRVPRPDLSLQRGTPNACNKCHADKTNQWAATWAARWFPHLSARTTPLADALYAADAGDPSATKKLWVVISDPNQGAIARASAIARLPSAAQAAQWEQFGQQLAASLSDPEPLVRHAAIDALADAPIEQRVRRLTPLLADPIRGVRVAAARWLAAAPAGALDAGDQSKLNGVLGEYAAIQAFNADRPESYNNLGTLYADQGDLPHALAALKTAMAIDPTLVASSLNLADIYQEMGQETEAQTLLLAALKRNPDDALVNHALGLSYLRQKRADDALPVLRKASEIDPQNGRFSYVYALALESEGQLPAAIKQLEIALQRHPNDRDAMQALVAFCTKLPDPSCARKYAARVAKLE